MGKESIIALLGAIGLIVIWLFYAWLIVYASGLVELLTIVGIFTVLGFIGLAIGFIVLSIGVIVITWS